MNIRKNILLANFTTWKVGGPAKWLAEPSSIEEIKELINWANKEKIKCYIIGAGSNLLINDSLWEGLIISMKKLQGSKIDKKSGIVEGFAGEPLPTLSRKVARAGLHGLEWAVGIPGTIGGAAVMNAGAQGDCTAEKLDSIKVISLTNGKEFKITNKELKFSYRKSLLQEENWLVISARFKLKPGFDEQVLNEITNKNLQRRLATQPYHLPSCGSVFRNPKNQKAGEIIEKLGLKGFKIGGAEISKTHANFIVNSNNATANDIYKLILHIQKEVKMKHGILLHTEVKQIGFEFPTNLKIS